MLDQVYSTNFKNLFCSVVILFLSFEGLYESLSKAFFRCALGAHARSSAFPGKAWKSVHLRTGRRGKSNRVRVHTQNVFWIHFF